MSFYSGKPIFPAGRPSYSGGGGPASSPTVSRPKLDLTSPAPTTTPTITKSFAPARSSVPALAPATPTPIREVPESLRKQSLPVVVLQEPPPPPKVFREPTSISTPVPSRQETKPSGQIMFPVPTPSGPASAILPPPPPPKVFVNPYTDPPPPPPKPEPVYPSSVPGRGQVQDETAPVQPALPQTSRNYTDPNGPNYIDPTVPLTAWDQKDPEEAIPLPPGTMPGGEDVLMVAKSPSMMAIAAGAGAGFLVGGPIGALIGAAGGYFATRSKAPVVAVGIYRPRW